MTYEQKGAESHGFYALPLPSFGEILAARVDFRLAGAGGWPGDRMRERMSGTKHPASGPVKRNIPFHETL